MLTLKQGWGNLWPVGNWPSYLKLMGIWTQQLLECHRLPCPSSTAIFMQYNKKEKGGKGDKILILHGFILTLHTWNIPFWERCINVWHSRSVGLAMTRLNGINIFYSRVGKGTDGKQGLWGENGRKNCFRHLSPLSSISGVCTELLMHTWCLMQARTFPSMETEDSLCLGRASCEHWSTEKLWAAANVGIWGGKLC